MHYKAKKKKNQNAARHGTRPGNRAKDVSPSVSKSANDKKLDEKRRKEGVEPLPRQKKEKGTHRCLLRPSPRSRLRGLRAGGGRARWRAEAPRRPLAPFSCLRVGRGALRLGGEAANPGRGIRGLMRWTDAWEGGDLVVGFALLAVSLTLVFLSAPGSAPPGRYASRFYVPARVVIFSGVSLIRHCAAGSCGQFNWSDGRLFSSMVLEPNLSFKGWLICGHKVGFGVVPKTGNPIDGPT